jgi:replicative DNA helicase
MGVGFAFAASDDVVGVDLDDAYLPTGELKPWAKEIFDRFSVTWAEKSVSGTGIHAIGRGERVVGKTTLEDIPGGGQIERYSEGRFFTVSGDVLTAGTVADVRASMAWLEERYFRPVVAAREQAVRKANSQGNYAPDPELDLELARVCLEHLKVERAHDADDWRKVGYALKATSEALAEDWLSFSKRWPDCDVEECRDRWRRFSPASAGLGSVVFMACADSGKTAVDLIREAKTRLGRPTGESDGKKTSLDPALEERLEAARHGVEVSGVLGLVLAGDEELKLYREMGVGVAGDVVAVPELTRQHWSRIAKAFPATRVQLIAGDLGDEAFRNSCRAAIETRSAPEAVVVVGPEAWQGEDDLPGWLDVHGAEDLGAILERHGKPAARWLADDALGSVSPASSDSVRREVVDRVLDAVAVCRGPRASLDVEDLLSAAEKATGYSREALESLIAKARERAEEKRLREKIGRELAGLAEAAGDGKGDPSEILERARETLDEISSRSAIVPLTPAFAVDEVEREARLVRPGFSTGWHDLDTMRVRLRPKELVALAARPSQGKTSALVWLLWQLLEQSDEGAVVFVTHEETKLSLLYRLYALASAFLVPEETTLSKYPDSRRWNRGDIRDWLAGTLDGPAGSFAKTKEKTELFRQARELVVEKTRRLIVIEDRHAGADRVARLCRVIHEAHGCRGVLLDYLQKLPHDGPDLAKGRRDLETAWACRALRERIALPFECPVVIAAQVNREALRDGWARRLLTALDPEKKAKKGGGEVDLEKRINEVERVLAEARPAPHMLRDGGIEHEADLILGVHNPATDLAWCKEKKRAFIDLAWPTNPTPLDVGVLKNRSGADGDWFRLAGDYGAGYFVTPTDADDRPEVGAVELSSWVPPEDTTANPFE